MKNLLSNPGLGIAKRRGMPSMMRRSVFGRWMLARFRSTRSAASWRLPFMLLRRQLQQATQTVNRTVVNSPAYYNLNFQLGLLWQRSGVVMDPAVPALAPVWQSTGKHIRHVAPASQVITNMVSGVSQAAETRESPVSSALVTLNLRQAISPPQASAGPATPTAKAQPRESHVQTSLSGTTPSVPPLVVPRPGRFTTLIQRFTHLNEDRRQAGRISPQIFHSVVTRATETVRSMGVHPSTHRDVSAIGTRASLGGTPEAPAALRTINFAFRPPAMARPRPAHPIRGVTRTQPATTGPLAAPVRRIMRTVLDQPAHSADSATPAGAIENRLTLGQVPPPSMILAKGPAAMAQSPQPESRPQGARQEPVAPPMPDMARLSEEVYRHIQRKMRIDRERRGA